MRPLYQMFSAEKPISVKGFLEKLLIYLKIVTECHLWRCLIFRHLPPHPNHNVDYQLVAHIDTFFLTLSGCSATENNTIISKFVIIDDNCAKSPQRCTQTKNS